MPEHKARELVQLLGCGLCGDLEAGHEAAHGLLEGAQAFLPGQRAKCRSACTPLVDPGSILARVDVAPLELTAQPALDVPLEPFEQTPLGSGLGLAFALRQESEEGLAHDLAVVGIRQVLRGVESG